MHQAAGTEGPVPMDFLTVAASSGRCLIWVKPRRLASR
jgi:hypothetical protein